MKPPRTAVWAARRRFLKTVSRALLVPLAWGFSGRKQWPPEAAWYRRLRPPVFTKKYTNQSGKLNSNQEQE